MTPYGYEIRDGKAVINLQEAEKLQKLFSRFAEGASLKQCAAESGVPRTPQTCRRMLSNQTYLGTEFFPALLTLELFRKVQEELKNREKHRKPTGREARIIAPPVYTAFTGKAVPRPEGMSRQEYASLLYDHILPVAAALERK